MTDTSTTGTSTTTDGTSTDTGSTSTGDGTTTTTTDQQQQGKEPTVEELRAEVEKWKTQSRKHEDRAKANKTAADELERVKRESMSEAEKLVAEARDAGKKEALSLVGGTLAKAEVRAQASGRIDEQQLATLLEHLDVAPFVGDDGTVDADKVKKFVDGIAPPAGEEGQQTQTPTRRRDLGQGNRGGDSSSMALNGDPILASVKSKLGIS